MAFRLARLPFLKPGIAAGILVALMAGCTEPPITTIASPGFNGFDSDNEGWHVNKGGKEQYRPAGGNPGGYLEGVDNADSAWYFVASAQFVRQVRFSYGRTLRFDLKQSATDTQMDFDDLIMTDGTTKLTFNTPYHPKTTWTNYAVKLDEVQGWKKGKAAATQADIHQMLENLTELYIRGEFRSGPDVGGLDNVSVY
ncbi:laminin B domain-containing protein [Spirosoma pulveris]